MKSDMKNLIIACVQFHTLRIQKLRLDLKSHKTAARKQTTKKTKKI